MAGDWIKMEVATPEKPEVMAITAAMGWDDPDLTIGKLFKLWRWFDQHTSDGNATSVTSGLLDRVVGAQGFCAACASAGWLTENPDGGVTLPNFERHNGKTAKRRSQTARRVSRHRSNADSNADRNTNSVSPPLQDALAREEKSESENEKISVSISEGENSPDDLNLNLSDDARHAGRNRYLLAVAPLLGREKGGRHPTDSKVYRSHRTQAERLFDRVWPEDDDTGGTRLMRLIELVQNSANKKTPMAWLQRCVAREWPKAKGVAA